VPLGPACQPVPPPGTVAMTHWSAPSPLPCSARHATPPPRGPQKVAVVKTGRVNYTTMEDIPKGEQVLTGTFYLNGHPTTVLFDSGASHDFISKAYT
jgi:hypothetical protein